MRSFTTLSYCWQKLSNLQELSDPAAARVYRSNLRIRTLSLDRCARL